MNSGLKGRFIFRIWGPRSLVCLSCKPTLHRGFAKAQDLGQRLHYLDMMSQLCALDCSADPARRKVTLPETEVLSSTLRQNRQPRIPCACPGSRRPRCLELQTVLPHARARARASTLVLRTKRVSLNRNLPAKPAKRTRSPSDKGSVPFPQWRGASDVLAYDYCGYGFSEGEPSEAPLGV